MISTLPPERATSVNLKFLDGTDAISIVGNLHLEVAGVFGIQGQVQIRPMPGGVTDFFFTNTGLDILSDGEVAFGFEGDAYSQMDPVVGLNLQTLRINEVIVFGADLARPSDCHW